MVRSRSLFEHPPAELLALLEAVKDQAQEDAPRLVLADWLEEHGRTPSERARAEFIRLQCQQTRAAWYEPADERVRALWRRSKRTWLGKLQDRLPPSAFTWSSRRGLLHVMAKGQKLLRALAGPLPGTWAWVEGLRVLGVGPATGERLAKEPALAGITTLELDSNRITPAALGAVSGSVHLRRLSSLTLVAPGLKAEAVQAVAQGASLAGLSVLKIGCNNLGPQAAEALARSPHLRRLRELDLGSCQIGDGGVSALASSPVLDSVQRLDVGGNSLTTAGIARLARSRRAGRLIDLGVGDNRFDVGVLVRSPLLPRLQRLRMWYVGLDAAGAAAFAEALVEPRLAELHLNSNSVGDAGARALAGSPGLSALRELGLRYCDIGPEGVAALARSPHLSQLRCLELSGNVVGRSARDLAGSPALQGLRRLDLDYAGIDADGARALAESPYLSQLSWFSLTGNEVGKAARRALKQRFGKILLVL